MNETSPVDHPSARERDLDVEIRYTEVAGDLSSLVAASGLVLDVQRTVANAIDWLLDAHTSEGFWVGNVDTNSCIEAEWLLATYIMGTRLPDEQGVINALIQRQRPDESWQTYVEAPDGD